MYAASGLAAEVPRVSREKQEMNQAHRMHTHKEHSAAHFELAITARVQYGLMFDFS